MDDSLQAGVLPVTPFQQNCSILWCPKTMEGAVVDPGGDIDRIAEALETRGVKAEKILITHGHVDHAGGAAELAERLSIPIEGPHRDDSFWIGKIAEMGREYGVDGAREFTPDRWLEGGDCVTVAGYEFDVYHCPGHTPGHVVFHQRGGDLAMVGDVLFRGSIGRTDLPHGDHDSLLHAIRDNLWPLGDDVTFIPGHGPTSTFGEERRTNPYVSDIALAHFE